MITHRSSSLTQTARASSKPHCSLSTPASAASSGSGETDHPSTPFAERATERCEIPRQRFHPGDQDRLAVDEGRGRVEDGVDRVRPVLGCEDRVAGMPPEELSLRGAHAALTLATRRRRTTGRPAASSTSSARWKASVDSAPSFAFSRPRRGRRCTRRWRSRRAGGRACSGRGTSRTRPARACRDPARL